MNNADKHFKYILEKDKWCSAEQGAFVHVSCLLYSAFINNTTVK